MAREDTNVRAGPRRVRVLLVEDDPAAVELVLRELRSGGFDVEADVVSSRKELSRRLSSNDYDVVLADQDLPRWTGPSDALAAAQEVGRETPFILLTSVLGEEAAVECLRRGAHDYVLKDRPARLPSAVASALRDRVLSEERNGAHAETLLLRTAIEQSVEAVVLTDAEGRIRYVNPAFTRLTGYDRDEVLGQNPRLLKSGRHDVPFYQEMWRTLRSGMVWRGELVNRRKDGGLYMEEMSITPVRDGRGRTTNYIALKHDVSERSRAEEQRALHTAVVNSMKEGLLVLDLDFRLVFWNRAMEEISGLTRGEVVGSGKRVWEHFPHLSQQGVNELMRRAGAGEEVARDDIPYHLANGREGFTSERYHPLFGPDGAVRGVIGLVREVSDQRRAEAALRESESTLRSLYESTTMLMGVVELLGDDLRIVSINSSAARVFGLDADAVPNPQAREAGLPPDLVESWVGHYRQALRSGAPLRIEREVETPAGPKRWSTVVTPIDRDDPPRFSFITEDVTDRIRLEAELRQAQKIEAVGRLAGGVAHDFNNLLGVIMGYGERLLKSVDSDDSRRKKLEEILKAAERGAGLTRQLLAFSRKQVLQPTSLDMNAVVADVKKMLGQLIGEDVALQTLLAEPLGRVRADRGQLEQVIMNLAINARDAMPDGGALTLETANVDLDESHARAHSGTNPGPHVLLTVRDTGCGMNAEELSHIFEPFFTTKESGSGLGLATVHGVVQQSGGHIIARSEPGKGTTFETYLPRLEGGAGSAAPETDPESIPRATETLLVVEDADALRSMVCEVLEEAGYTVLQARDADEAAEAARAHGGPVHGLLTDVILPGTHGPDLAALLQAARPGLRVLYMSGYTAEAIDRHGVLDPGTHFIQKPFTTYDLLSKLRGALSDHG